MVAGLLAKCGLNFGLADELMPPNHGNALGYFENERIVYHINDALLEHFGGSWQDIPDLPDNWVNLPELATIRAEAKTVIDNFSDQPYWAFKDPRGSLLLPFWQELLSELKVVVCLRNPLDVALSLHRRDGMPVEQGATLWHEYVTRILATSRESNRIITFYEDFFAAPKIELARLIEFLDLPYYHHNRSLHRSIATRLRHHHSTHAELEHSTAISDDCKALFFELRAQRDIISEAAALQRLEDNTSSAPPTTPSIPETRLQFPKSKKPLVSIIIPTHNRADLLAACLRSVLHYTHQPYEVIVVDDASTDHTDQLLDKLDNVTVIRNEQNLDFLRSSNAGAAKASGEYLLFLNNDVSVSSGWLEALVDTIKRIDKCGAVGAKLISTTGLLQEAGAIINEDGQVELYGGGDNSFKPEYNYVREVDYCSAACLLLHRNLFESLGGFDTRYIPAYYEDVDLCMSIWQLGYKVIYQPNATVIHHQLGSRTYQSAINLCDSNRPKLKEKWIDTLKLFEMDNQFDKLTRRKHTRLAVLIDQVNSLTDTNQELLRELSLISEKGYAVSIAPLGDPLPTKNIIELVQQQGIEIFYGSRFDAKLLFQKRQNKYDIVVTTNNIADHADLPEITRYQAGAKIVTEREFLQSAIIKEK